MKSSGLGREGSSTASRTTSRSSICAWAACSEPPPPQPNRQETPMNANTSPGLHNADFMARRPPRCRAAWARPTRCSPPRPSMPRSGTSKAAASSTPSPASPWSTPAIATARGRRGAGAAHPLQPHLLPGRGLRRLPAPGRAPQRARPGRCGEEDHAGEHRRRGGRERGQDRARLHRPPGRDRLQRRSTAARCSRSASPARSTPTSSASALPGEIYHAPIRMPCMTSAWMTPSTASSAVQERHRGPPRRRLHRRAGAGRGRLPPARRRVLQRLRTLADKHGIPLIADEIQSGIGALRQDVCDEHSGVVPDLITPRALAAASGRGVVGRAEVMDALVPGGLAAPMPARRWPGQPRSPCLT